MSPGRNPPPARPNSHSTSPSAAITSPMMTRFLPNESTPIECLSRVRVQPSSGGQHPFAGPRVKSAFRRRRDRRLRVSSSPRKKSTASMLLERIHSLALAATRGDTQQIFRGLAAGASSTDRSTHFGAADFGVPFFFAALGGISFGWPTLSHVGAPGVAGSSSICTSFTCTSAMPPL